MEEESVANRSVLDGLEQAMRIRCQDINQNVDVPTKKIETIEKKFEVHAKQVVTI